MTNLASGATHRYKSGMMMGSLIGYHDFRAALQQLTNDDRAGMRKQLRDNNKAAAQIVVDRAKELVPLGPRNKPRTKHLRGAIRNVSSARTVKIVAGNKNVWWGWMVHAGTTDTEWPSGRDYPAGQPFLREAVRQTWPEFRKIHRKGMNKVVDSWNAQQRRAFMARGRI